MALLYGGAIILSLGAAVGAVEEVLVPGRLLLLAAVVADADAAGALGAAFGAVELLAAPGGLLLLAAVHADAALGLAAEAELGGVLVHEEVGEIEAARGGEQRLVGDGVAAHGVHGHQLDALAEPADAAEDGDVVRVAADEDGHVVGARDGGQVGHLRGEVGVHPLAVGGGGGLFAEVDLGDVHLVAAGLAEEIVEDLLLDGVVAHLVDGDGAVVARADDVHLLPADFGEGLGDDVGDPLVVDLEALFAEFVEKRLPTLVKPAPIDEYHCANGHDCSFLI